jgi:hypothetical protein
MFAVRRPSCRKFNEGMLGDPPDEPPLPARCRAWKAATAVGSASDRNR